MSHTPNQSVVNSWLHDLGQIANDTFRLNDQGLCVMQHQEGIEIVIEAPEESESFHVYSSLIALPEYDHPNFLKEVLALNLFQLETAGGTLALDPRSNEIVFCYMAGVEGQSSATFQNVVNNFIDTALRLKSLLQDRLHHGDQSKTEASPLPAGFVAQQKAAAMAKIEGATTEQKPQDPPPAAKKPEVPDNKPFSPPNIHHLRP